MNVLDEFLKHVHYVEKRANQLTQDLMAVLRESRAGILGKLAALESDILKAPFNDDRLIRRKKLLEAQKSAIDKLIRDAFKEMHVHIKAAAEDTLEGTAARTFTILDTVTPGAAIAFKEIRLPVVKKWMETATIDGLLPNEMLSRLEASSRDRIVAISRRSLIEGNSVQQMARMIRNQGIEGSFAGIEGLSRTMLLSASNYAKEQIVNEHFSDVVTGWRYLSTLDGRTCLVCGANDGQAYDIGKPKPVLPRHFRCRCTYVPITRTFKDLGVDMDEPKEGARPTVKHSSRWVNHRDGTRSREFTPEKEASSFTGTYQEWLKQQLEKDPAFVRDVLGPKRYELFKAGKLSLKSMVVDGYTKHL